MNDEELYNIARKVYKIKSDRDYSIDVFGGFLAKREGYKALSGMEAIHFYLVNKYHWLPSVVKGLSSDDIDFLLSEERYGWRLPDDAR
ncbi:MAG: hypothetical protein LBL72_08510 [Candidatus Accumulibacter sp.]|jgi:hypothetical protein|nr:hypothetical protein [Accumulibacter sp.]